MSLVNKELLLTAYAYLCIMEQQQSQQGTEAIQLEMKQTKKKIPEIFPCGDLRGANEPFCYGGHANTEVCHEDEKMKELYQLADPDEAAKIESLGVTIKDPVTDGDRCVLTNFFRQHLSKKKNVHTYSVPLFNKFAIQLKKKTQLDKVHKNHTKSTNWNLCRPIDATIALEKFYGLTDSVRELERSDINAGPVEFSPENEEIILQYLRTATFTRDSEAMRKAMAEFLKKFGGETLVDWSTSERQLEYRNVVKEWKKVLEAVKRAEAVQQAAFQATYRRV